jgi:ATP-dependent protease Clp ATPase subunit
VGSAAKGIDMADLPLNILTDAGFTADEANSIVEALVKGTDLHIAESNAHSINIDDLPAEKKEALERFTMATAADF